MSFFGPDLRNGLPIGLGSLTALARAVAAVAPPPATDSFFKYVTLLLHGDGTNGAQNNTFLDGSTNNFTITRNGNTTQGSFSPFSQTGWSNFFDGTGDDLRSANAGAAANLGATWTVELWLCPNNVSGTGAIVNVNINTSNQGINIYRNGATITVDNGVLAGTGPSGGTLVANTWQHVAVVADGTNTKIYLNGSQVGLTFSGTVTSGTPTHFWIGASVIGLSNWAGYISNLRIVKGTAVYTANFTPPTAPLTAITNTSLLTCQSNRFRDNSSNAFAITRNGDVRVEAFSPFNPSTTYSTANVGGSGYFDGTGDYLTAPDNAALDFGSGDFTIESWVYPTTSPAADPFIWGKRTASGNYAPILFGLKKNGTNFNIAFWGSLNGSTWGINGAFAGGTITISQNTWTHIAVVRSGTTITGYVNGVADLTVTSISGALMTNTSATALGASDTSGSNPFSGYISNLRALKGTAQYTANFTPPTAPLTAITNTSLLLNYTNGGVFDNASQTVLETVGNAQVSTTEKKFGTGSMYFDGTGDWLTAIDRPPLRFGTGAFTIEFWIYLESSSITQGVIAKGTSTTGWLVWIDTSDRVALTYTTSTLTSTGSLSTLTWHHIAVVREGTGSNQTKIYIDGTNAGTGTVSTDFNQTSVMYIGANRIGGDVFSGYIDDLRITNGYARYTANFTPPTAAFPDN